MDQTITKQTEKKKAAFTVKQITLIGVLTAVTCVLAPLSIPIGPVPISLTNFVIYFALYILGVQQGTISYIVYLLIGLVGVPVFSGYTSGPAKLFGPTGGYLIGFIFLALIAGFFIDRFSKNRWICLAGMILGTAVCYAFGTIWYVYEAGVGMWAALGTCVFPFIPFDLIKMVIAMIAGPQVQKTVRKLL